MRPTWITQPANLDVPWVNRNYGDAVGLICLRMASGTIPQLGYEGRGVGATGTGNLNVTVVPRPGQLES